MRQKAPVLLTIDDDQEIVDMISAIASRAGFRAVSSTAPERLQELIEAEHPDAIVLDLQMPGRDGVSALRLLADAQSPAKIFLVTGMDERTIAAAEQ
jgi:DNA-binding response OmpR family regulator